MQRRGKGCFYPNLLAAALSISHWEYRLHRFGAPDFRLLQQPFREHGREYICVKICALTLLTTGVLCAGIAMAADKLIVSSTWGVPSEFD
ncbi:hypothetical protein MMF79_00029535 [Klebsiella pneumoniae]